MSKLSVVAGLIVLASSLAPPARAVGPCELYKHEIEILGYSAKYKQVAVKHRYAFCVEGHEFKAAGPGGDVRYEFVDVHKSDGALKRRFIWSGDLAELQSLKAKINGAPAPIQAYIKGKVLARDLIEGHLKEGKFTPVPAAKESPSKRCWFYIRDPQLDEPGDPDQSKQVMFAFKDEAGKPTWANREIPCGGKVSGQGHWFTIGAGRGLFLLNYTDADIWVPGGGDFSDQKLLWITPKDVPGLAACF